VYQRQYSELYLRRSARFQLTSLWSKASSLEISSSRLTSKWSREPATSHNCENMELLQSIISPNSSLNNTSIIYLVHIQAHYTILRLFLTQHFIGPNLWHPKHLHFCHTHLPLQALSHTIAMNSQNSLDAVLRRNSGAIKPQGFSSTPTILPTHLSTPPAVIRLAFIAV